MKNAVLVLGYNNTRVNDVRKIRQKSEQFLDAKTVLCKRSPTPEDVAAADYVIDVGLDGDDTNVNIVIDFCNDHDLKITALLPFSDPGTQLGAAVAKRVMLNGPCPLKVKAALDKGCFRRHETESVDVPNGYKKIRSEKVTSLEQLQTISESLNGKVFLKPASEGNSRGCINTTQQENLEQAWLQVSKYLDGGIVAEELIDQGNEYSWDHVNGYSWITEKQTTQNEYRAEIQQILPAPLNDDEKKLISDAGEFMSNLSGSNKGACHNEIFYDKDTNSVIGVEPNLRPAGMRIWDLAALAFDNFDPWKEWLQWAAGQSNSSMNVLDHKFYVGIRMIQAPATGVMKEIPSINLQEISNPFVEVVELTWTKKCGDSVTKHIKDNSDFIGFVIARSESYTKLSNILQMTCNELATQVTIQ